MNIDKVKYNLEFGQFSYGRLFIEKYKELSLDISLLGKYFSIKNGILYNGCTDCIGQLVGLVERNSGKFESSKNNKIHYKFREKEYVLLFKIIQLIDENNIKRRDIGYIDCKLSDLDKSFKLIK